MHSIDFYRYYLTPETPIMSSVMADCPDSAPLLNILEKSTPVLVILFIGHCDAPQFL